MKTLKGRLQKFRSDLYAKTIAANEMRDFEVETVLTEVKAAGIVA